MPWLQIIFPVEAQQVDALSEKLLEIGALSVTLADQQDNPIFEPELGTTPLWEKTRVISLFDAQTQPKRIIQWLQEQLGSAITEGYEIQQLEDQDWERVCLKDFHAMRFGKRLWVCPTWETEIPTDGIQVILDPGLAFGTGTHPTTALCLEWLDSHIEGGEVVIDYGCGSGILALAAYKLGAAKVWAVDNDPQALQATLENSKTNHIPKEGITALFPADLPTEPADIVIANILAQPLIDLAPTLATLVKPNGKIALSGILSEQVAKVLNSYQTWFKFSTPYLKDEWALLWGVKLPH